MEKKESEYWRWKEYAWKSPDLNWEDFEIITAGVDIGSVSSQAVVMGDGQLLAYSNMRTGSNSPDSARNAMNWALE
ncbi:MAG: benzoyl-CoA reductase, bzd-type, subunit Q, partial [Thermoplasmata archaeon]